MTDIVLILVESFDKRDLAVRETAITSNTACFQFRFAHFQHQFLRRLELWHVFRVYADVPVRTEKVLLPVTEVLGKYFVYCGKSSVGVDACYSLDRVFKSGMRVLPIVLNLFALGNVMSD